MSTDEQLEVAKNALAWIANNQFRDEYEDDGGTAEEWGVDDISELIEMAFENMIVAARNTLEKMGVEPPKNGWGR